MAAKRNSPDLIIIKKYANRRLYNTDTSSYVTLDDLAQMVRDGTDFQVLDAKSNDDITHSILTQIIFEQEGRGQNLLPVSFLRQIIRFYDDSMQALVPSYLEYSIDALMKDQDALRKQVNKAFGSNPLALMQEQAQNNLALFRNSLMGFSPFVGAASDGGSASKQELADIKQQMADMQEKLNKIVPKD